MSETATSTPDINELRARAVTLGFKDIKKRGDEYRLMGAHGEITHGSIGLDVLADDLAGMEANDARLATETDVPDFDAMTDGELVRRVRESGTIGMNEQQVDRYESCIRSQQIRAEHCQRHTASIRGGKRAIDTRSYGVDDIHIADSRRALNEVAVVDMMKSIEEVGLLSPPIVRWVKDVVIDGEEYDRAPSLVTGRHRLEAMKRLGHTSILCVTLKEGDDGDAELMEIAENLHRADLTVLERAKQRTRWIELTESKREVLRQLDAKLEPAKAGRPEGGIRAAARELKVPESDLRRDVKIVSLSQEAKDAAVEASLDDNRSALLEAAKEVEPEKQVAVLKERKTKSADAAERKRDEAECKRLYQNVLDAEVAAAKGKTETKKPAAKHKPMTIEAARKAAAPVHLSEENYAFGIEFLETLQESGMTLDKWKSRITEPLQAELARLTEENAALRTAKDESDARYRELWAFVDEDARNAFMGQVAA